MNNVKHNPVKYTSTGQYRNACQNMVHKFQSVQDENGDWVVDRTKRLPTVNYVGTVKLHGTNGSFIQFEDQKIYCQSKSRILDITHDNAGFFEAMSRVDKDSIFEQFKEIYRAEYNKEPEYPITICGEWAGGNVQKGVAISEVPKFFSIFGARVGGEVHHWVSPLVLKDLHRNEDNIYNICQFGFKQIGIDFENPKMVTAQIEQLVLEAEATCPAGKYFGVEGIGEGYVWKPEGNRELEADSGFWFKTKGDKHSVSKVKKLVATCPEKLNSISEFVTYAATENRFMQGIGEVGLSMKSVGEFIGWVNRDIWKEEADVLAENGLTMKEVGKDIATAARRFYIEKVNDDI